MTTKQWDQWQDCLDILRAQNTRAGFDTVYQNSTAYLGPKKIIIVAQSAMAQEWMEKRQHKTIQQAIKTAYPEFKNGSGDTEIIYRWPEYPNLEDEIQSLNRINRNDVGSEAILGFMSKKEAHTQYFRRFWRPLLGPTLSELIRELRQRGYYGKEDDGPKEEIHVKLDTLAEALGISYRTLDRILERDKDGKFKKKYLNLFVTSMETIKRYDPEKGRKVNDHVLFMVRQIDPLIPEHEEIF